MSSPPPAATRETWLLRLLFIGALGYSFYALTYHWTMGYLAGQEFRQTQTAITTYYIDRNDNFSLLYETPILGKPWVSVLLEVPIYQWAVVGLSRATDLPHHVAARTISAASFYLTLPAVWLLLGRLGLSRGRRLLPLALMLAAPAHVFYARSFMIDALALLGSVWWLAGFVRTMDTRRWSWLGLTVVAGTLAALVKSATLAVWLIPGAAYGAWLLGCDLRARRGWAATLQTLLWGLATVVVALGALRGWVAYTDPIKATHASAWIFTSEALTQGNWGLFNFSAVFSAEVWRHWMTGWEQAIMSRWLIGAGLLAGLIFPAARWRVFGLALLFFAAQFLFPFAYAYQDYYYYSCTIFVLAALGCALLGALDARVPWWMVGLMTVVLLGAEVNAYWRGYRQEQSRIFNGDHDFTAALRKLTPKSSVLVVAGADWAAPTPYYAQRKALMVRHGLEYDETYLRRAFQDLADEEMSALVLHGKLRQNAAFIQRAASAFDLVADGPTFSAPNVDVYVARPYDRAVRAGLGDLARYPEITLHPALEAESREAPRAVTPEVAREALAGVTPAPYQMRFRSAEPGRQGRADDSVILAHSSADLWVEPTQGARRIQWTFGIFAEAYAGPGGKTDGVDFSIWGERPDGQERRLYRRLLDPAQNPGDRGDLRAEVAYTPLPGEKLRFATRPGGSSAYDWAYWVTIEVQ